MSYRYIGNKTRLLPAILNQLKALAPSGGTVVDLMCGTASVSEALRTAGFKVIAVDLMTYAAHHARVRLQFSEAPGFEQLQIGSYFDVLAYLETLPPTSLFFFREYSPAGRPLSGSPPRMYFTAENAALIDAINSKINSWYTSGKISEKENSLLRHDLILAINRVANIAGTYGHFRSKWSNGALNRLRLEPTNFIRGFSTDHTVIQGRAEDVAPQIEADLCYIDPPYMKRQYAANYHIIETVARGDEPEAVGISGLRPWRDQYSNFCTKTRIKDSFNKIISEMNCDKFAISYSEDGLLQKENLENLLSVFGSVSTIALPFQRFRSNNSPLKRFLNEYLFILKKH